jgi:hypothetical protein
MQVAARLDALVRQELVQPDRSAAVPLPSESGEGYRFRHILIRSVVYERMTESVRAELHERYADHLEQTAGERISQFDEMIGFHLNESFRYRRQLGPLDEHARLLARRAGERYAAAGQRAALRGDIPPATRPAWRSCPTWRTPCRPPVSSSAPSASTTTSWRPPAPAATRGPPRMPSSGGCT